MERPIDLLRQLVLRVGQRQQREHLQERLQLATVRLQEAEARCRQTAADLDQVLQVQRPRLDQATRDEQELPVLKRRLAELFHQMQEEERRLAEEQLVLADSQVKELLQSATAEINQAQAAHEESLHELAAVRHELEEARRKIQELGPPAAELLEQAATRLDATAQWFPLGQIRGLQAEVEAAAAHFDVLSRAEQHAQLRVWLGKLRRLQAANLADEEQQASQAVFRKLAELSKTYQPGFIDAFDRSFNANWNSFIHQAEEDLRKAAAQRQEDEQRERAQEARRLQAEQERRQRRASGQGYLEELRSLIDQGQLDSDTQAQEAFRKAVALAINALGASDEGLISMVVPYEQIVSQGNEFRALRRHLEKLRSRGGTADADAQLELADVLRFTRNRKIVMIGGSPREEARLQIEQAFQPAELAWEGCEGTRPGLLESLEQRVRNGSIDVLVLLRSFISHTVSDRLRPACQEGGVACVTVDRGYGVAQIADAIRCGPLRCAAE